MPPDDVLAPVPLRDASARGEFSRVRMLATDIDGTLTTGGVITGNVLSALAELADAGIEVLPVSGRSTGEVLGLARYLPGVERAIAENGQVLVAPDRPLRRLRTEGERDGLKEIGRAIGDELDTQLALAPDDFCRVGDVAYERAGRDAAELETIVHAARAKGVHCIWSSVHVHLSWGAPDKGAALLGLLDEWDVDSGRVATLGDAPNDAGLFDADRFGVTVGTADVLKDFDQFPSMPRWVSSFREGAAMCELADLILGKLTALGIEQTVGEVS